MTINGARFPSPLAGEGAETRSVEAGEGVRGVAPCEAPSPGAHDVRATLSRGGRGAGAHDLETLRKQRGKQAPPPTIATIGNARALRRQMTDAERALWRVLRDRQLARAKFRRQVPIGPYVADFLSYDHRLVIEVDGGQHADSTCDTKRDAWLAANGFRTLRFWNNDVLANSEGVLARLIEALR